jgi:hypothetical protein
MLAASRFVYRYFGSLILLLFIIPSQAQKNTLKGSVVDTAENRKLHYSIVALINKADSVLYQSVRTNVEGAFEITRIPPGNYTLMVSYPKMADFLHELTITDTSTIDLGKVIMITEAKLLEEVVVRAGVPIRMRGDTLEYTADSFALKPNSSVEELLKRLPGIQVERDGKIIAQGQEVKKVLVDGDEFFSDDPGLALKYLQSGAVDKVQVFDQKSEQAQFTGIDDGTRNKTINLKLKKNKKNGYFGKLSAGADGKDYYQHEGMGALFSGTRKMSVFGVAAKTGRQGLSYNDMSKYVAQDYEMISDGTGGVIFSNYGSNDNESENYYGNGIPSVLYGGAHFSDRWNGDRQKLFGNYRVKEIKANGWGNSSSTNILPDGTGFRNKNESREMVYGFSQKASGSFAIMLDSFTTLKVALNGGMGKTSNHTQSTSESKNEKGFLVNNSEQSNKNLGENRRFGSNITYQRKFRKEGRTVSLTFQQDYSRVLSDVYAFSALNYYDPASGNFKNADTLNQLQQTKNPFESYAVRGVYTDKITKELGFSVEYGWKTAQAANVFNTFNQQQGKFDARVDSLSNDYDFLVKTHISGATLSWTRKKINITAGSKVFHTGLDQVNNDLKEQTKRRFINLAPQLNVSLRIFKNSNINLNYSGNTSQPSIEQLQPLRRTSTRLYIQEGNPDLKPAFMHRGSINFNKYNPVKGSSVYGNIGFNYTDNAITNQRSTDAQNRTVSKYINLDGVMNIYGNMSYNWQYKPLHLRPSISANLSKGGGNSILNGTRIRNENVYGSVRTSLTHDWKDVMSTSYSGSANYSVGWSDAPNNKTNRNFSHSHTLANTFFLPFKMELSSDCNFQFQPKNNAFSKSTNIIQWNAFLQKKLLKNDEALIKFSVNDILNQNTGYNRSVSGNNVYESNRLVLKRYWLLTVTWNFTKTL